MLLVQELMSQYDRLLIIDAIDRRASPGSVFLLSIDGVRDAERVDTHFAVPAAALSVARALNVLPAEVKMLGCQPDPQSMEDLSTELSPAVKGAIGKALEMINSLLDESSSQSVERAYAHDGNAAGEGRHLADLPQHQPHESLSAPAPIERRETPEA
jgi:hydrogenase maturation protease